ncbi:phage major capsid protein [Mesorhizobium sp.]|uniref:phage major capsid protein n=1 Tax=Mesorhizobium sp. TaxID=1871066 RepID=UPI000FE4F30E|nr:phage major capsid protein [Mesorhizobium sp.]RWF66854.1 MAG: phage major capsid protein [Mesorhizobium sp.]
MTKHVVLRAGNGLLAVSAAALCAAAFGPIMMDATAARITALENEITDLTAEHEELIAKADEEERDLDEDELAKLEEIAGKISAKKVQLEARKRPEPVASAGRRSTSEPQNRNGNGDGQRRVPAGPRDSNRFGFTSFGTFAKAVQNHYRQVDNDEVNKLRNTATTFGNEGTGAEGGFLVPPEFSREIWQKVMAEENLLSRCAPLQTGGNSIMIPKDETTPWQNTGGIQVYWEGEGQAPAASKPLLEMGAFRLFKLFGLVPVSEELLEDAIGLESWLRVKAPAKMAAKINTSIVGGTGVGQPKGIIPGYAAVDTSVVQVSKETSQPADTIWMTNIEKMWSRMYAPWRRNAVWLINQDLEPQLAGMAFQASGASSALPGTSAVPAYLPPGGLSNAPYGTLKGRPVIPIEACSAIGDLGDIIFADFNQYWALTKGSGAIQTDTSIHLYFDQALTAFRFIFRVNGQPAWSSTIDRQNGSNTLSWATTLQAR